MGNDATRLNGALIEALYASADVTELEWAEALRAVPRHLFAPSRGWSDAGYPVDRDARPDEWLRAVYLPDHAIVTQTADGAADPAEGDAPATSSLSAPSIVASFLGLLEPYAGDTVLEIGTGTGWTAALLSHRIGEQNVTTIEVDPALAELATKNLNNAGFAPRVVIGDGTLGYSDEAPFDRVHVTAGAEHLPYAWVEQTRPGGMITFPWMPGFDGGHRMRLTVNRDGVAIGRMFGGAAYMMLRSQRPPDPPSWATWHQSQTSLDPRRLVRASSGANIYVAARLGRVYCTYGPDEDSTYAVSLWDDAGSVAQAIHLPGYATFSVNQAGPRNLWNEAEAAFFAWLALGEPSRERFGMTISSEGQHVWVDDPSQIISN